MMERLRFDSSLESVFQCLEGYRAVNADMVILFLVLTGLNCNSFCLFMNKSELKMKTKKHEHTPSLCACVSFISAVPMFRHSQS